MDGSGCNHYVASLEAPACGRPTWNLLLELLLFLSAMLAGLSGLISGDRAVELRQVERTAVAVSAAADLATQKADTAAHVVQSDRVHAFVSPAASVPALAAVPPFAFQTAPVDERRLE